MSSGYVILNTKVWEKVVERCVKMHGLVAKVGIQGDKAEARHDDKSPLTTAQIAAVHEFSEPTDSPPGRPFIRPVYENDPEKWKAKVQEACHKVLMGANPVGELRKVGEEFRRAIIERMRAGIAPPLADSTLARRNPGGAAKRDKLEKKGRLDNVPLIDTETMLGALSVVVEEKGK